MTYSASFHFHDGTIIIIPILFLLLVGPTNADPPGSPPGPNGPGNDPYGKGFNPSMGVVIIVLIAALFFMGFFSIYIRHCSEDSSTSGSVTRRALAGAVARSRRAPRGLDREVIDSFPVFDYAAVKTLKIGKGALECAVCLTEFDDEDTLRLIPKCDHVFHPDCIDAWLVGHTTCPVCRSNLTEPGDLTNTPGVQNEVVVDVNGEVEERESNHHGDVDEGGETMEEPLRGVGVGVGVNRSRTMRRNSSLVGRPRLWLGRMRFTRSYSTGHMAVKQWENMERFTLRLPDEVRKQVMSGKLERTTSLVVLPRETSSRRGYRTGFGEGSSRGSVRFGSARVDRGNNNDNGRSDRWVFSLVPPFFSRGSSVKVGTSASREGSLRGSIRNGSTRSVRLPV